MTFSHFILPLVIREIDIYDENFQNLSEITHQTRTENLVYGKTLVYLKKCVRYYKR